ncbi:hypothetical protein IV203_022251 [Nitzschia inconspicua]|uniref:Uncharacterized protein n=1 Tax=Nitzschia inconspicua TaxID=303405 RepID=A0A9K3KIB1_9STRA|nr:hypothetical protein IV203_022251 [Nitzschia inconspicua]
MANSTAKYSQVAVNGDDDDDDGNISFEVVADPNQDDGIEMIGLVGDEEDKEDDEDDDIFQDEMEDQNEPYGVDSAAEQSRILRQRFSFDVLEEQLLWNVWNRWEEPALLSIIVTGIMLLPNLILWMYGAFAFVGRFWSLWIFVLPLQLRISVASWYIQSVSTVSFQHRRRLRILCSIMTLLEVTFLLVYQALGKILTMAFFRDADGSIVYEWEREVRFIRIATVFSWMVILSRCAVGLTTMAVRTLKYTYPDTYREWRPTFWTPGRDESFSDSTRAKLLWSFRSFNILVLGFHTLCILSAASHFGPWPMYSLPEDCDPLDDTECGLPFPSFHHMKEDPTTPTGWRVHLRGLPPLRGGIPFHPRFLNELDGFSTMAPMLFYMNGLKEAHEKGDNRKELQGPERIEFSVTAESITLLLDVEEQTLVHHSAEVDYLDPDHPLVLIFPAQPLKHSTHYAVVVIGAMDEFGRKLPKTKGMINVMKSTNSPTRKRWFEKVIPALHRAADWYSFTREPESLQLIFDFVTISEQSQLGTIRTARDKGLDIVSKWNWQEHVDVVSLIDYECCHDCLIARTIHLNLDVPSFLESESRYSFLDHRKLQRRHPVATGRAKALVQIPCSIRNKEQDAKAIVEFGHGLFYNREEVTDHFLQKMANDNGYLMMAMDWRGMSSYDLPIVIKTLIGTPDLFQAVRDNLIQGYVNKLCLQHFSQNGMLDLDAFKFDGNAMSTVDDAAPASIFYGISQGGILGAGYVSLAGKTKLIDRGILGVPGTPFALVLTRSLDFAGYDTLILFNFYNNRHVRMLLSLVQMAWDPAEASGHRAMPTTEPIPRLLLQAGLGDPVVPTIAAEALARSLGASTLPNTPRAIFGISQAPAASSDGSTLGPDVTLSELLYEREFNSLPLDDRFASENSVHWCVRVDKAFVQQMEEFINTGRVLDPCIEDECRRESAVC